MQGGHYLVYNKTLKTPEVEDYLFPGKSLTIVDPSAKLPFLVFANNFKIPVLRLVDVRLAKGTGTVRNNVRIFVERLEISGNKNTFVVPNDSYMEIDGPMYGNGCVNIIGNPSNGSKGRVRLAGDNSNYIGQIKVSVDTATPDPDTIFQTLLIDDEKALGGAMDEMMFDALELNAYGTLEVTNSFRIAAERNRGIYVNGDGAISVPQGEKLAVDTLVTLEGSLVKKGEGTLSLGGTLDVRSASELVVTNGVVEVAAADAINGASVKFSKDAALAIALGSSDANLRNYGIRNLSDAPFAADTAQVPLYVDIPSVGDGVKNIECALFTVKTEHYAAADAMFVPKRTGAVRRGWVMKFSSRENGDGSTTKTANLERAGFAVMVR